MNVFTVYCWKVENIEKRPEMPLLKNQGAYLVQNIFVARHSDPIELF